MPGNSAPQRTPRGSGEAPIVIAGAGLAGLSLACALLEEGIDDQIVLVDRRREWGRDRTWGTWETGPLRFGHLATHRWSRWRLTGTDRDAVLTSWAHPYLHLNSRDVYAAALAQLSGAGNVSLRLGESIRGVDRTSGQPRLVTDRGTLEARMVFSGMGPSDPHFRTARRGGVELLQGFVGWEVEVEREIFDPTTMTLMGFRPDHRRLLRFLYVLPFSPTRALVEDTTFGRGQIAAAERRDSLREEMDRLSDGAAWQIRHEERGLIPMSTRRPDLTGPDCAVYPIGVAAGAIRPSSGYAFSRIQQHSTDIARAWASGRPLPDHVGSPRAAALDLIFLHAFDRAPARFAEVFLDLAARVPGDVFARFMTDASSPLDEAQVIAALPRLPLLAALGPGVLADLKALMPRLL